MWRGPPLAEFGDEPFARELIPRLAELRLEAVEARIEADLMVGRDRELVAELEGLVAAHPLRERPRAQLMLALYRCGRQADALAVYRQTRVLLDAELGLEPGDELQRLQNAVLAHDPRLQLSGRRRGQPRTLHTNGPDTPTVASAAWRNATVRSAPAIPRWIRQLQRSPRRRLRWAGLYAVACC